MDNFAEPDFVNVGAGKNLTIKELAEMIKEIIGFASEIVGDASKPKGTPRKLRDVSKMENLGWRYEIELKTGINNI